MEDNLEDLTIEELLKDVDVLGNPGWYWTLVGAAVVLSLFAATTVWRITYRLKGVRV